MYDPNIRGILMLFVQKDNLALWERPCFSKSYFTDAHNGIKIMLCLRIWNI